MTPKDINIRGQIFAVEDGVVVVEWYDHGEDVAYEFAVQVRLDRAGQAKFATALELSDALDPDALCATLKQRFGSYFAVHEFADAHDIPYELKRDLQA